MLCESCLLWHRVPELAERAGGGSGSAAPCGGARRRRRREAREEKRLRCEATNGVSSTHTNDFVPSSAHTATSHGSYAVATPNAKPLWENRVPLRLGLDVEEAR